MSKKSEAPKRIVLTPANYDPKLHGDHEQPCEVSMTVPDESYTVEQILEKFTRGLKLPIGFETEYSDSDDFDDIDNVTINDLTEIEELMMNKAVIEKRKAGRLKTDSNITGENKPTDDKRSAKEGEQKSPVAESV